jgi:hypothetical protein
MAAAFSRPARLAQISKTSAKDQQNISMSDHKRVFGKTFAELDALAKEAARRAVADLHAHGIPTYHMEGGKIIQTAPDGTRRELMNEQRSDNTSRRA